MDNLTGYEGPSLTIEESKQCGDYYRDLSANYSEYYNGPTFAWPDKPKHCPEPYIIDGLN